MAPAGAASYPEWIEADGSVIEFTTKRLDADGNEEEVGSFTIEIGGFSEVNGGDRRRHFDQVGDGATLREGGYTVRQDTREIIWSSDQEAAGSYYHLWLPAGTDVGDTVVIGNFPHVVWDTIELDEFGGGAAYVLMFYDEIPTEYGNVSYFSSYAYSVDTGMLLYVEKEFEGLFSLTDVRQSYSLAGGGGLTDAWPSGAWVPVVGVGAVGLGGAGFAAYRMKRPVTPAVPAFCVECGHAKSDDERFCVSCGAPSRTEPAKPEGS